LKLEYCQLIDKLQYLCKSHWPLCYHFKDVLHFLLEFGKYKTLASLPPIKLKNKSYLVRNKLFHRIAISLTHVVICHSPNYALFCFILILQLQESDCVAVFLTNPHLAISNFSVVSLTSSQLICC